MRALVIGSIGRALAGGAGTALPAPRPSLHLVHSRSAGGAVPRGSAAGLGEAGFAFGAAPAARMLPAPNRSRAPETIPLGAPVAQVLDTYVIAVAADGALVLVDQHAAHERLTHEALREQMLDGGVRPQPLLLPAVVELRRRDAARLLARAAELARLGLEIEPFGAGAVLVRALPAALGSPEPGPLLRDLADELAEHGRDHGAGRAAGCGDRAAGVPREIRAGRRLARGRDGLRCCAGWRPPRAPPRAATGGRPSSSCQRPRSSGCSAVGECRKVPFRQQPLVKPIRIACSEAKNVRSIGYAVSHPNSFRWLGGNNGNARHRVRLGRSHYLPECWRP